METSWASYLAVVAAFLSAIATGFTVWATLQGPVTAAKLAERMRREGDTAAERRRLRMVVFTTLMQHRSTIASEEAVRALNLIDVIYQDEKDVRDAWAELFLVFNQKPVDNNKIDEKLRELLRRMAISLQIAETLRMDDFSRTYFPAALADEQMIRHLQREAVKRELGGESPAANTAPVSVSRSEKPS